MSTIGKLLFGTTGFLTQKEIMRRCAVFGEKISENLLADGKSVSTIQLEEILKEVLGKRALKIRFVSSREDMITVLQENIHMPKRSALKQAEMARAMTVPKGFGRHTTIIAPKELIGEEIVNWAPHELEHALKNTFSFSEKFVAKIAPIKNYYMKIKKMLFKDSKTFDEKNTEYNNIAREMQALLLNLAQVGEKGAIGIKKQAPTTNGLENFLQVDSKFLQDLLRERIYTRIFKFREIDDCKNYKQLLEKIDVLKKMLKDERNAYKAGGLNEHKYFEELGIDMEGKSSHSELVSILYNEAYKLLKQEERHIKHNYIKSLVKIKPNLKFEEEFLMGKEPRCMSFEEILNMCSEDSSFTLELIKIEPDSNLAKYVLSGKDKRFDSILNEVKEICRKG